LTTNPHKVPVYVFKGDEPARYGFGDGHPFGHDRHGVFYDELEAADVGDSIQYAGPRRASVDELALFHSPDYIHLVSKKIC
jgi:acetoin utilization protein AcuC